LIVWHSLALFFEFSTCALTLNFGACLTLVNDFVLDCLLLKFFFVSKVYLYF